MNTNIRCNNEKLLSKIIETINGKGLLDEFEIRKIASEIIEKYPRSYLSINGNSVWNIKRLVKDFSKLVNDYRYENFSTYLYEFFHLQCGSIAHFNKFYWFEEYKTLPALRDFFIKNEYGSSVLNYAPSWHYDARIAQNLLYEMIV